MQWFARGRLWASREAEREDFQLQKHATSAPRERRADRPEGTEGAERRGSDWRPGGAHKDPRDRFKKKNRPERAWSEKDPATQRDRDKPGYVARPPSGGWRDKPAGPPRGDRPPARSSFDRKPSGGGWSNKPPDRSGPPRERKPWHDKPAPPSDRPWQTKPTGPRAQRKPWVGKPGPPGEGAGFKPRGDRPWSPKPSAGAPRSDRPWSNKPPSGEKRPWSPKPSSGAPRGDRPWSNKPPSGEKRPWSPKPPGAGDPRDPRRSSPDRPPSGGGWSGRPPSGDKRPWSGKPRSEKPGGFSTGGPPRGDRKPWQNKPFRPSGPPRPDTRGSGAGPRKRRDDEPPDRD